MNSKSSCWALSDTGGLYGGHGGPGGLCRTFTGHHGADGEFYRMLEGFRGDAVGGDAHANNRSGVICGVRVTRV